MPAKKTSKKATTKKSTSTKATSSKSTAKKSGKKSSSPGIVSKVKKTAGEILGGAATGAAVGALGVVADTVSGLAESGAKSVKKASPTKAKTA
ncbi:MAG: hypothetical protein H0V31_05155, partial [Acidobacteria bacterium]|nr:hypothetical protein [Acidobacteriota bacterium]